MEHAAGSLRKRNNNAYHGDGIPRFKMKELDCPQLMFLGDQFVGSDGNPFLIERWLFDALQVAGTPVESDAANFM